MAQQLYSGRIETGKFQPTGVLLDQTSFLIIVNRDIANDFVTPWGYVNYMSTDTPILGGNISFAAKECATHQTAFYPQIPFVPSAELWIYVMKSWVFSDALIEVWSPFDP